MKTESKECDCKKGHRDQLKAYPVGTKVRTLCAISEKVKTGVVGEVRDHCDDGRAFMFFEGEAHTFHFPKGYVEALPA